MTGADILVAGLDCSYVGIAAETYHAKGRLALVAGVETRCRVPAALRKEFKIFSLMNRGLGRCLGGRRYWDLRWKMYPLWNAWMRTRTLPKGIRAVEAPGWSAEAAFDIAERLGALKVYDSLNSHPVTCADIMRRELAEFAPGAANDLPDFMVRQATRDAERADLILCPSNRVRDTMAQHGVDARRCRVIPFGVDLEGFRPRPRTPAGARTFLAVGTVCFRKGHHYLLEAFRQLSGIHPDARLLLVGPISSAFAPTWESYRGLPNLGHVPQMAPADIARALAESLAFVFPTLDEGFARASLEAMAVAVPVITTRASGITTLAQPGADFLCCEERDVESLIACMRLLLEDETERERLGAAAALLSGKCQSWPSYAETCLRAIDEFLEGKAG